MTIKLSGGQGDIDLARLVVGLLRRTDKGKKHENG
jgi:hypothetical protein